MKESLISYGAVFTDFKLIARHKRNLEGIKKGAIKQTRIDCYDLGIPYEEILKKFDSLKNSFSTIEIFYPSDNYPPHKDEGGLSYFIPLESGVFYIDNVSYPVVPFVLYAFDDGKLHNTNFAAIMLK